MPYNPYLSLLFNCHINVEVCTSITAVKYLYKYVYKGHDRAQVDVGPVDVAAPDSAAPVQPLMRDEIKIYQDGRYVSASEASHHLYGFDLHKEHPYVVRLAVHLKGRQTILFQEGTNVAAVFNRNPHTTLTTCLHLTKQHGSMSIHLHHCVWLLTRFTMIFHALPHGKRRKSNGHSAHGCQVYCLSTACTLCNPPRGRGTSCIFCYITCLGLRLLRT